MKKRYLSLLLVTIVLLMSLVVPFFYSESIVLGHYRGDIVRLQLDGCVYVLESGGDKFELEGYDDGERDDVIVYYTAITSGISVCMIGSIIRAIFVINN